MGRRAACWRRNWQGSMCTSWAYSTHDLLWASGQPAAQAAGWRWQGGSTMMHTMGRADVHLHTCHSDGAPTVRALLAHVAARTQLNVIAITDHDTIAGAVEAQAI